MGAQGTHIYPLEWLPLAAKLDHLRLGLVRSAIKRQEMDGRHSLEEYFVKSGDSGTSRLRRYKRTISRSLVASGVVAGLAIGAVTFASAARQDPPPQLPDWARPDGSVDTSLFPDMIGLLDSEGRPAGQVSKSELFAPPRPAPGPDAPGGRLMRGFVHDPSDSEGREGEAPSGWEFRDPGSDGDS